MKKSFYDYLEKATIVYDESLKDKVQAALLISSMIAPFFIVNEFKKSNDAYMKEFNKIELELKDKTKEEKIKQAAKEIAILKKDDSQESRNKISFLRNYIMDLQTKKGQIRQRYLRNVEDTVNIDN